MNKSFQILIMGSILFLLAFAVLKNPAFLTLKKSHVSERNNKANTPPRIVNIINFIRQCEPRNSSITEEVLYRTVLRQIQLLAAYDLPGTFLLQYDALIDPRYAKLLKDSLGSHSEIGAWWEITQPHVEAAGLEWRGRFQWDWHADVGFATGYAPTEREKLVDVYMEKFKSIFGKYPATVGSWFIDSHTLAYMYDKYGIVGSSNCKDQVGTDGYTLWGGYWNNGYYPSRKNAYMPAQNTENQIPVPIFRMLGSDPIYQYDNGLGTALQQVESLEPVYPESGGNRKWVEYYFQSAFTDPALNFTYTQAGQENSFTWDLMKGGLEMQISLLDSLRKEGTVRIETLEQTARWFRERFPVTPATATSALADHRAEGHKTVWFNSRYYRANLLWKDDAFRIRDIHLFDENMESRYLRQAGTSSQFVYTTLPIVDGFLWSTADNRAGLRLVEIGPDGNATEIPCGAPSLTSLPDSGLRVEWKDQSSQSTFMLSFYEDHFEMMNLSTAHKVFWALELRVASGVQLPFVSIEEQAITANVDGFAYVLGCDRGKIAGPQGKDDFVFRLLPAHHGKIKINCSQRGK